MGNWGSGRQEKIKGFGVPAVAKWVKNLTAAVHVDP